MRKTTFAALAVAVILIAGITASGEAFADKKDPKTLEQHCEKKKGFAGLICEAIESLQVAVQGITNDVTTLLGITADHETRLSVLESSGGGETYDDTEIRAEIAALKAKTQATIFDSQGATTQTISAPPGRTGIISFVAINNPDCRFNSVDLVPGTFQFIQYGWCPQSEVNKFLMPNRNVTDNSVISITIGRQPITVGSSLFEPIQCWSGRADNYTVADGETGEIINVEGFLVKCNGSTRAGMTMIGTINNP